jgi:hypothetical protein
LIEDLLVTDIAGKAIWRSNKISAEHHQIDVASLSNGIYLLTARTQSGQVTKKFEVFK